MRRGLSASSSHGWRQGASSLAFRRCSSSPPPSSAQRPNSSQKRRPSLRRDDDVLVNAGGVGAARIAPRQHDLRASAPRRDLRPTHEGAREDAFFAFSPSSLYQTLVQEVSCLANPVCQASACLGSTHGGLHMVALGAMGSLARSAASVLASRNRWASSDACASNAPIRSGLRHDRPR